MDSNVQKPPLFWPEMYDEIHRNAWKGSHGVPPYKFSYIFTENCVFWLFTKRIPPWRTHVPKQTYMLLPAFEKITKKISCKSFGKFRLT